MDSSFGCVLKVPPVNFCQVKNSNKVAIGQLKKALNEPSMFNCPLLINEATLLSRIVYKMKNVYRQHKGYHYIEMAKRCLCKHQYLDLAKSCSTFQSHLPDGLDHKAVIELPSKQMMHHLLVRIIAAAKLLVQCSLYCKLAAGYLYEMIKLGMVWPQCSVMLSVVSRIYVLCPIMLRKYCSWYNRLIQYKSLFVLVGTSVFVPVGSLPQDLTVVLEADGFKFSVVSGRSSKTQVDRLFDEQDAVSSLDGQLPYDEPGFIEQAKSFSDSTSFLDALFSEIKEPDLGVRYVQETHDSDDGSSSPPPSSTQSGPPRAILVDEIDTVDKLERFVEMETQLRQHRGVQCQSSNMTVQKWQKLTQQMHNTVKMMKKVVATDVYRTRVLADTRKFLKKAFQQ